MDLAILSARVFTGNPERPWAEAVGIEKNRIRLVGDNRTIQANCKTGTRIFDLPGRLVTPGLVEGHCHFVNFGMMLRWVNLRNLSSLESCRETIRRSVPSYRPGQWIIGRAWNHNLWGNRLEPTRKDLDDIAPDNPVMMIRACGHSVWVNSAALKLAGIDRNTPDPPGGRIDRDLKTGEPTGLLREARKMIEKHIPPPSLEERKRLASAAQGEALRFGITGVHSCETLFQWEALSALEEEGALKLRVHHLLPPDELEAAARREILHKAGDRLWLGHVKLFADGSLGAGTALLHEPYTDAPSECGIACTPLDQLEEKIRLAYSFGKDVAIHAIGDLAVTNALTAISAARKAHPGARRDRVEHVQLVRRQDLALFRDLDVVASVQPVFVPTDWQPASRRWGTDRCRSSYIWKSIREAGVRHQFGSDAPVEPIDPLLGLQAAVTRMTPSGEPEGGWYPEEKLTLEEAIEGFTRTAAWSSRKEDRLGSLSPGKLADLTVFHRDLFDVPAAEWASVETEMTVIDGEVVYSRF
jgi:predicted amidohydrolase YtcJ